MQEYLSSSFFKVSKASYIHRVKSHDKTEKFSSHNAAGNPKGHYRLISFAEHLQRVTSSGLFKRGKSCSHEKWPFLLESAHMYQVLGVELVSRQFYWEAKSNQCQMPFTFGTPSNLVMPIKIVKLDLRGIEFISIRLGSILRSILVRR